jgi:hypothetical protein
LEQIRIEDLRPGASIRGALKNGYALKKHRNPDGTLFYAAPSKGTTFSPTDLQFFIGMVIANDPLNKILRMAVGEVTPQGRPVGGTLVAEIHYLALKHLLVIDLFSTAPRVKNPMNLTLNYKYSSYRKSRKVLL